MTARSDLHLRPLLAADAPQVLDAFISNPDMARQGDVTDLASATEYVSHLLAPTSPHRPWAIIMNHVMVGLVCVTVDAQNRSGWFWYWLHADARGLGIVKRAAATVADWALTIGGLERLELGHRVNNPASGAVAVAAGFVREGTERGKFLIGSERIDVATYGRLRSDPEPVVDPLPMDSVQVWAE